MATYIVKRGDTLGKIAKRLYGDASLFTRIVAANHIANPDRLRIGQVLEIPDGATPLLPAPPIQPTPPTENGPSTLDRLNAKRLATLHPVVAERGSQLLQRAAAEGLTLVVTQGIRSFEEQNTLYAKGRTKPPIGRQYIVTKAKGGYSWHNFGLAFDVVVLDSLGKEDWDYRHPGWALAGALGRSVGLEWGGDWPTFKDYPHFQYAGELTLADCRTLYANGLDGIWSRLA
jgi:hypothetical protein